MEVPGSELDAWARAAARLRNGAGKMVGLLAAGDREECRQVAVDLCVAAGELLSRLERAGAEPTDDRLRDSVEKDVPLELLTSPTNRRYRDTLRQAWEAAVAVDKERGWFPDGEADFVEDLLARVELEVEGPVGRGERR